MASESRVLWTYVDAETGAPWTPYHYPTESACDVDAAKEMRCCISVAYVRFDDYEAALKETAARETRLVALLADARALVDAGWMLLTENGQSAEWHDHRRAWIAACEEVTGG